MISTATQNNLGGRDFDAAIANHFAAEFKTKYRVSYLVHFLSSYLYIFRN